MRAKYQKSRFQALYQLGRLASINKKWLEEGKNAYIAFINHETVHGTPPKSWAAYRLGIIYNHLKQKDLAQQSFKNALSLNPEKNLREKINKEIS
ncbi:MAG: tetratricopeptide repeat protein [Proteobacteria bacterium]|nr:tetratricopeptide repeat protein [Pseudomonadota bacterium]